MNIFVKVGEYKSEKSCKWLIDELNEFKSSSNPSKKNIKPCKVEKQLDLVAIQKKNIFFQCEGKRFYFEGDNQALLAKLRINSNYNTQNSRHQALAETYCSNQNTLSYYYKKCNKQQSSKCVGMAVAAWVYSCSFE